MTRVRAKEGLNSILKTEKEAGRGTAWAGRGTPALGTSLTKMLKTIAISAQERTSIRKNVTSKFVVLGFISASVLSLLASSTQPPRIYIPNIPNWSGRRCAWHRGISDSLLPRRSVDSHPEPLRSIFRFSVTLSGHFCLRRRYHDTSTDTPDTITLDTTTFEKQAGLPVSPDGRGRYDSTAFLGGESDADLTAPLYASSPGNRRHRAAWE